MALVVTAADVATRIGAIDTSLHSTDAAAKACPEGKLTPATLAQWESFKKAWNGFVQAVGNDSISIPFTGLGFATFNPYTVESELDNTGGWGDQAVAWQQTIAKACSAQGPGPAPSKPPGAPWSDGKVIAVSVAVTAVAATLVVGVVYAGKVASAFR